MFHKYLGDSKMFEYDKHYRECQQIEQDKIKKLIQTEIEFVELSSKKFNDYNIDKETAWFDGVSAEHVHDFCESLYDLTQKYHN